jgi:hypothetical protein
MPLYSDPCCYLPGTISGAVSNTVKGIAACILVDGGIYSAVAEHHDDCFGNLYTLDCIVFFIPDFYFRLFLYIL